MKHQANYQSYLLRLWRESAHNAWRASLHSTSTDQTFQFASIEALFAFLSLRLEENDAELTIAPPMRLDV